jgi:hypothetical protein
MVKTLGLLMFILALFIIGTSCLFFPERVQAIMTRAVTWGQSSRIEALNNFVGSKHYLISVRVVGALSLLCSAFLLLMLIKNS